VGERDDRQRRFAQNEALFREVNERIRNLAEAWRQDEPIEFTCECANPDCAERIFLTISDYESAREHPARFLVAPGHLDLEVERVVAERPGYWLVEKQGRAGQLAADLDPRS
jgi:hypothetical protein